MSTKLADDSASIKARMEEIAAERRARIMGTPIEAPHDMEAELTALYANSRPATLAEIAAMGPYQNFGRTYDSKYLHEGD